MAYKCEQCSAVSEQEGKCPLCGVPMRQKIDMPKEKKKEAKEEKQSATEGSTEEAQEEGEA